MIKRILFSVCFLITVSSLAQEGTASPYSFFGIGDVRFKGTVEMRAMAGIGIEQDSIHINLDNPSSFANLKLTTFALACSFNSTNLKSSQESAVAQRTALDYLAVGFPIGNKAGIGFGLIPYSSVGYKIESIATNSSQNSRRLEGRGGLNKVFLGFGFKILPNLSFGADAHYNFGKIETSSVEFLSSIPVGTRELNNANLTGFNFNLGLLFQTKISSKTNFYSSVNYTIDSFIKSSNVSTISTVLIDSEFNNSIVDAGKEINATANLNLPSRISIGMGFGTSKNWLVGAQYSTRNAAGFVNSYNNYASVMYEKYQKLSIGGYYIPNYNSFSSYTKRLVFRGGFKLEQTGLVINSRSINDVGATMGIGFPVSGTFSNVNLGVEIGKRGETSQGLIQENYAIFSLSLSLNDRWFQKRKFD